MPVRPVACCLLILVMHIAALPARAQSQNYVGDGQNTLPNRMAMLVGVPAYQGLWGTLDNVNRDLPKVKETLETLGFDSPIVVNADSAPNRMVTRALIYQRLYQFMEDGRSSPGSMMVFYFAGHGFTHEGKMFLVPADAPIAYAEDPDRFAIPLADVVGIIKAARPLVGIIVIDACRDLPFTELAPFASPDTKLRLETGGSDSLALEDTEPNIGIFYSATKGEKALDGLAGSTSYFVTGLVGALRDAIDRTAGGDGAPATVNIRDVVDDTIARVQQLTSNRQNPRQDLPFPYRLPLFSTERAFKAEKAAWGALQEQTDLPALLRVYPNLNLQTAQEKIYCLRFSFLKTYGYSYFWRDADRLVRAVHTAEAARQCLDKVTVAAAPIFAPQTAQVIAPNGDVSGQRVRSTTEAPAAPPVPAGPAAPPAGSGAPGPTAGPPTAGPATPPPAAAIASPERSLLLDAVDTKSNSRVLLSAASTLAQPDFPGAPRSVPLPAGEGVTFIQFVDRGHQTARVFHPVHGFGNVPTSALASQNAIIRVALSYNSGQFELSDAQKDVLGIQLADARAVKAISATIRFPRSDRTLGFRRAQAIVTYLATASGLPADRAASFVFPTMIDAPDLESNVVTLAILIEQDTAKASKTDIRVELPQAISTGTTAPQTPPQNPIAVRVFDVRSK